MHFTSDQDNLLQGTGCNSQAMSNTYYVLMQTYFQLADSEGSKKTFLSMLHYFLGIVKLVFHIFFNVPSTVIEIR